MRKLKDYGYVELTKFERRHKERYDKLMQFYEECKKIGEDSDKYIMSISLPDVDSSGDYACATFAEIQGESIKILYTLIV